MEFYNLVGFLNTNNFFTLAVSLFPKILGREIKVIKEFDLVKPVDMSIHQLKNEKCLEM